jgi:ABC-type Zn2+ transport system substrate-binding protein/surface adhesin
MMAMERAEAQAERASQRAQFAEFVVATRQALADAIVQDDADMEAVIAEREASLAARLAEQSRILNEDMDACVEAFRLALKETYNYNSHDFGVVSNPDTTTAPYTQQ